MGSMLTTMRISLDYMVLTCPTAQHRARSGLNTDFQWARLLDQQLGMHDGIVT